MGELRNHIRNYFEGSTIHGFRYVVGSKSVFARIIWFAIIFGMYLTSNIPRIVWIDIVNCKFLGEKTHFFQPLLQLLCCYVCSRWKRTKYFQLRRRSNLHPFRLYRFRQLLSTGKKWIAGQSSGKNSPETVLPFAFIKYNAHKYGIT